MRIVPADKSGIAKAAELLRSGEVVAYPTETVYGLAVDPFNAAAVEKLYRCKGRPEANPVLLVVADVEQLSPLASAISPQAHACMKDFWPGPLSILFPRSSAVPDTLTAGTEWVCVRCPGAEIARELCRTFGGAITSTSANTSGKPPATRAQEINLPGVALVLDGGALPSQTPSTIVNPQTGEVLREGAVPAAQVLEILRRQ